MSTIKYHSNVFQVIFGGAFIQDLLRLLIDGYNETILVFYLIRYKSLNTIILMIHFDLDFGVKFNRSMISFLGIKIDIYFYYIVFKIMSRSGVRVSTSELTWL